MWYCSSLDEKFWKNLKDKDRDFYENQTGQVFNLLKSNNLTRFIEIFILETYDNYEDFINFYLKIFLNY